LIGRFPPIKIEENFLSMNMLVRNTWTRLSPISVSLREFRSKIRHLEIKRDKKARMKRRAIGARGIYAVYQVPEVEEDEAVVVKKLKTVTGPEIVDTSNVDRNRGEEEF
jgi:hypothetical protein